jgi:hypothetical protein
MTWGSPLGLRVPGKGHPARIVLIMQPFPQTLALGANPGQHGENHPRRRAQGAVVS